MNVLITGASGFIGANCASIFRGRGHHVIGYDRVPPLPGIIIDEMYLGDLRDQRSIEEAIVKSMPDVIIHLAARTDIDQHDPESYSMNLLGTQALFKACKSVDCVSRVIIASTMLVHRLGHMAVNDIPFTANTGYGISKARMEEWIRSGEYGDRWVIVRPTTIWGPWHLRWIREFLGRVERKRFLHPSNGICLRSYGYVGNVVHQILQMAQAPDEQVHGQTFYVGDPAIRLDAFVDACYRAYHQRNAPRLPYSLLKCGALCGDALGALGFKFPLTSYRLKNMTTDNVIDMQKTIDLCGPSPYTMEEGIAETVRWAQDNRSLWQ